jgi:hypothetical protein
MGQLIYWDWNVVNVDLAYDILSSVASPDELEEWRQCSIDDDSGSDDDDDDDVDDDWDLNFFFFSAFALGVYVFLILSTLLALWTYLDTFFYMYCVILTAWFGFSNVVSGLYSYVVKDIVWYV